MKRSASPVARLRCSSAIPFNICKEISGVIPGLLAREDVGVPVLSVPAVVAAEAVGVSLTPLRTSGSFSALRSLTCVLPGDTAQVKTCARLRISSGITAAPHQTSVQGSPSNRGLDEGACLFRRSSRVSGVGTQATCCQRESILLCAAARAGRQLRYRPARLLALGPHTCVSDRSHCRRIGKGIAGLGDELSVVASRSQ